MPYVDKTNIGGSIFDIRDTSVRDMFAGTYDPMKMYKYGDVVMYDDNLYRCKSKVVIGGGLSTTDWVKTTLGDICAKVLQDVNSVMEVTMGMVSRETAAYSVDLYVLSSGKICQIVGQTRAKNPTSVWDTNAVSNNEVPKPYIGDVYSYSPPFSQIGAAAHLAILVDSNGALKFAWGEPGKLYHINVVYLTK